MTNRYEPAALPSKQENMMFRPAHTLVAIGLALALSACNRAADAQTADMTVLAPPAKHLTTAADAAIPGINGMIIQCMEARIHLTSAPSSDNVVRTSVKLEKNGQHQELAPPAEMQDYTAVGLGCTDDGKGNSFLIVQFGEIPYGCAFCEWFFLYDMKGQLLNHASPPLREEAGQQSPNNDEYEQKLTELGLKHPEMTLFQP